MSNNTVLVRSSFSSHKLFKAVFGALLILKIVTFSVIWQWLLLRLKGFHCFIIIDLWIRLSDCLIDLEDQVQRSLILSECKCLLLCLREVNQVEYGIEQVMIDLQRLLI